jgi:hypothetical protein
MGGPPAFRKSNASQQRGNAVLHAGEVIFKTWAAPKGPFVTKETKRVADDAGDAAIVARHAEAP